MVRRPSYEAPEAGSEEEGLGTEPHIADGGRGLSPIAVSDIMGKEKT